MPLQRVQLAPSPEMDTHWHIWECQVREGIQSGQTVTVTTSDRSPWGEPGEL